MCASQVRSGHFPSQLKTTALGHSEEPQFHYSRFFTFGNGLFRELPPFGRRLQLLKAKWKTVRRKHHPRLEESYPWVGGYKKWNSQNAEWFRIQASPTQIGRKALQLFVHMCCFEVEVGRNVEYHVGKGRDTVAIKLDMEKRTHVAFKNFKSSVQIYL